MKIIEVKNLGKDYKIKQNKDFKSYITIYITYFIKTEMLDRFILRPLNVLF